MAREILQIRGFDELDRKLKTLDKKVQKKVLRSSVKEAMTIVLHAARSAAPVLTGLLVSTLRVVAKSSRRRGTVSAVVRTKDGDFKGDTFYGAFIEFGHKIGRRGSEAAAVAKSIANQLRKASRAVRTATGGKGGLAKKGSALRERQEAFFAREGSRQTAGITGRREVAPNPFMRNSLDNNKDRVIAKLGQSLGAGIEAVAKESA